MLLLIAALAIAAIITVFIILTYNHLIDRRLLVDNAWAQIEVQLKRRFDLIPNLVEVVKGYAKHEKSIFEKIAEFRSRFINAKDDEEKLKINDGLTGALKTVFAIAENYPKLMASNNFKELQKELSRTEDKIAYMRHFYNDAVYRYNVMISVFPSNIVAKLFHFEPRQMFEAEGEEKEPVKIKI